MEEVVMTVKKRNKGRVTARKMGNLERISAT